MSCVSAHKALECPCGSVYPGIFGLPRRRWAHRRRGAVQAGTKRVRETDYSTYVPVSGAPFVLAVHIFGVPLYTSHTGSKNGKATSTLGGILRQM